MLRTGHIVVLCALALLTLGVVMVNSAEMAVSPMTPEAAALNAGVTQEGVTFQSIATSTAAKHMLMALAALTVAALFPVGLLRRAVGRVGQMFSPLVLLSVGVIVLVGLLATVYWSPIARPVNGSNRWVTVGPIQSIQPSELGKWFLIWLIAAYAVWVGRERLAKFWVGFVPAVVAIGIVSAFVVLEDLGTGVLMATAASLVLLAAGGRVLHFALIVPLGLVGIGAAIIQNPYRIQRVSSFLDPYADPQNSGFHMIQSMATVAGGGVTGRGLGNGLQKFGYLPEDQTDFLFAIISEELGLAGAMLTLTLYAVLVWAILAIVRRQDDGYDRLVHGLHCLDGRPRALDTRNKG